MLDFDSLREIWSTVKKNKMRTFLTGFAVAWGIFMLIILLGAGNGLRNAVTSNMASRAKNSVSLWPGWTSIPYKGMPNRQITFDHKDYDLIKNKIPEIEYVSARISHPTTLSYEKEYGAFSLEGVSQDAVHINNIKILNGEGRFINQLDVENRRKVIVISPDQKKVLFKNESPLGKYVNAGNISYLIIGVYDNEDVYDNNPPAYIPFTTAQMLYNKGYGFRQIDFTIKGLHTVEENNKFIEKLREKLGKLHFFDPQDRSAIRIWNTADDAIEAQNTFSAITVFLWIIGIASLMAGIVGVGNIMLITVKERTREIGIRKAIGATPKSILKLIITESIIITSVAGYIGIVIGIAITEAVSNSLAQTETKGPSIFKDPTVDLSTAIWALVILIIAGLIAGLVPALKAVRVRPIEAMRAE